MEKFTTAVLLFLLTGYFVSAQEENLLVGVDNPSHRKEVVTNAFKSSRVINGIASSYTLFFRVHSLHLHYR